jgi:hypothetical protein
VVLSATKQKQFGTMTAAAAPISAIQFKKDLGDFQVKAMQKSSSLIGSNEAG